MPRKRTLFSTLLVMALALSLAPSLSMAQVTRYGVDAVVLVNSDSIDYSDFGQFVQPYLDHFGIPYTPLDIFTADIGADIGDYALIIVGHRQLDPGNLYLSPTEEGYISAAVSAGTGLVNFDNDLSVGGTTTRYQFIQDIFDFDYVPPGTGAGVTFTSVEGGGSLQINCWEDSHQDPILSTTTNASDLLPDDNQWTEFLYPSRGYPGVFAGYDESPPRMRFYGAVPDGEYELIAHLYWSDNLRYYWGYTADEPEAFSFDVTSGTHGDFADYSLDTVTVTDGLFELYVQNADRLPNGVEYPYWGWAWIRLVPVSGPPPVMHYITERHTAGESIGTGSMTMAGITLPEGATALAMTGSQPFLAVTDYGAGHAVQWGSYDWMSHSVKGPVYGLDDLVWRSIVWAARKPFVMQGMPPFLTMRVDDESGPFDWIHVANEFGIKPWAGLFYYNVDAAEAADLSALVHAGMATASVHAKSGTFFYYNHGVGDFTDAEIEANYAHATAWHTTYDIPISKFVLPHYYEFGTNVFEGLSDWGVEFVGTMMDPGNGYGAPWIMNGPYRLYETGGSSGGLPVYYAGFMEVPGHPEFDGQFFNCVTEIRDDAGYEWYPSSDVAASIGKGTRQSKRALDSMALATLFTHDQHVSGITMANWRAILQGITDNLAEYDPIYVTVDHACQYVRAMYTSDIASGTYDPVERQVTTEISGQTDMPTMFYLFTEQAGDIQQLLIDVPTFSGATTVDYTLAGPLDHIVVSPESATVAAGGTQSFIAQGYDAEDNPIPNLPFTWAVVNGGGTIDTNGQFTAGLAPGSYSDTVEASFGGISGHASVEVVMPVLDHFTFEPVGSPRYVGAPFQVTVAARDISGNLLLGYSGLANLSDSTGTIVPSITGSFSGGMWSGEVTIDQVADDVSITASDGTATGISNTFDVTALGPGPYTIWGSTIPSSSYVGDSNAVELGVRFQAASNGYITGLRFWKDLGNSGPHVGHLWTADGTVLAEVAFTGETVSGWQQVTLPEPIPILADTTYVASYHSTTGYNAARNYFSVSGYDNPPLRALADGEGGGNGVYCYDSDPCTYPVNTYQASNYWVDVVFATDESPPPVCVDEPCTIWDDTFVPAQPSVDDPTTRADGVELGVKFRSSVVGFVTGVRFYKGSNETDDHPVHLWAADGTLLAQAQFTGLMTPGWKEVAFAEPVPILANITYVASYHTSTPWALTRPYFTNGYDNPPLRALASGEDGGNGVYAYGTPSLFPANTYQYSNYWVDVVFAGVPVNEPPVADAGGPYAYIFEGDSVTLDASGSSGPDDNIVLYEWDLDNDGEYDDATGVTTDVVFDDDGTFTVGLRVTDEYGESDTDTADVLVDNVAPTVDAGADQTVDEGTTVTLDPATFDDPGTADTHTATIDWGDGSSPEAGAVTKSDGSGTVAGSHVYENNGMYTVQVCVSDDEEAETCDTLDITVENVAPAVDAGADQTADEGTTVTLDPATFDDPGTADTHTATIDWGDGSSPEAGAVTESDGSGTVAGSHVYENNGMYAVQVCVSDDEEAETCDTLDVTVVNVAPTVDAGADQAADEGTTVSLDPATFTDPGTADSHTATVDWGDGSPTEAGVVTESDGSGTVAGSHVYADNGTYTVQVCVTDDDEAEACDTLDVAVDNVAPVVTVDIDSQTVQYSDGIAEVTFTATDVAADEMTASTETLPNSLTLGDGTCSDSDGIKTCTWTVSGNVNVPADDYSIGLTVADDNDDEGYAETTITVVREDAKVRFGDENTVAVRVTEAGGTSESFTLTFYVREAYNVDDEVEPNGEPLVAPGNIGLAEASLTLIPVGPGGSVVGSCTPGDVTGSGYGARLPVTCSFSGVPVNTYTAEATVSGDYYTGLGEDVLTVYDPSLGFATGGGWFYWPGTEEKTNFGFTMKYKKNGGKVQGSLLLIRHVADDAIYRVKSNALYGLALGVGDEFGWASFSGKSTYLEPGWLEPIGNHEFVVYVEDRDEPGTGIDRIWIEMHDKDGLVIEVMSIPRDAPANAAEIGGGNIVVPH